MSGYGRVGINVGSVGRWTRFVLGIVVLLFVAADFFPVSHSHSGTSYLMMVLSFGAITLVYTLVHYLIGDWLKDKNAWWGTLIFVAPAMFLIIGPAFDTGWQVGYWLGLPELNHPFRLALFFYIGVSLLFQWRAKYGGCEMVAIPNFIVRKTYGSYCVPLLPLDFAEKLIVDKRREPTEEIRPPEAGNSKHSGTP